MSSDPIGDLFATNAQPKDASKPTNWLVIVLLLAIVSYFAWQRLSPYVEPYFKDKQEQNDGDKKGSDKKDSDQKNDKKKDQSISGAVLVFVLEKQTKSADQELVLRSLSEYVAAKNLSGFRVFDDDQAEAKPFIDYGATKQLSPPMVIILKDKQFIRAAKFPEHVTYKEFESVLK